MPLKHAQRLPKTRKEAIQRGHRFYFTGKECINGHVDKRYATNYSCVACMKVRVKAWVKTHRIYWNEYQRRKQHEYRARDPQKYDERIKKWNRANPEKVREYKRTSYYRRKAREAASALSLLPWYKRLWYRIKQRANLERQS